MKLGSALPLGDLAGGPLQPGSIAASARRIEELGYSSLWTFDAVGRGFILPEPLMALAIAASATDKLDLGTGIFQLPIRNVADVAHRALTLSLVAGSRFKFGVGPGSTAADFEAFGGEYDERFATFDQQWDQLRSLMETGRSGAIELSPWSDTLGAAPLMLAGWRGRWVERAATEAKGWIASAVYADDETLADAIGRYRDKGGDNAIVTNLQLSDDLGPGIDRLHRLAAMGFDEAVVFDLTPSTDRLAEVIGRFNG